MNFLTKALLFGMPIAQAALANIVDASAEQTYANTLTVTKTGALSAWLLDVANKEDAGFKLVNDAAANTFFAV